MAEKDYQSLFKIEKHPGFFRNLESQKIYWRGTIRGKAIKKATGTTKITEAKRIIEEFLLSLTSENIDRAVRERRGIVNPPLKMLWDEMVVLRSADKTKSTLVNYEKEWRLRYEPFMGKDNLSVVSQKWVIEFENWFLKTFPGMVYFNTGKYLQMFLNYLHQEGYVQKKFKVRPLDKTFIEARTKKKKVGRVYTDEEKEALISNMPTGMGKAALTLLFSTGARKMEILSRKWEDYDPNEKTLNIWSDKNKKWRTVPLSTHAVKALDLWFSECGDSPFIFPMKTDLGRHISGQLLDKEWVISKRRVKLKGRARIHDIRHTVASKTASDGWPIPIACLYLDMTPKIYMQTYVHIDPKDLLKWMRVSFERSAT